MSSLVDAVAMENDAWRERLRVALKTSGMSDRKVSLAAGFGAGYVHSIMVEGKDPTIEKLMAICEQIEVSVPYVLYGVDVTPEDLDLLTIMKQSPEKRDAVLTLLRPRPRGDSVVTPLRFEARPEPEKPEQ